MLKLEYTHGAHCTCTGENWIGISGAFVRCVVNNTWDAIMLQSYCTNSVLMIAHGLFVDLRIVIPLVHLSLNVVQLWSGCVPLVFTGAFALCYVNSS